MYFLFNVNEAKIKGSVIRRQMKKYWKTAAFERPEILWSVLVLQSFMEKKGLEFSLWLEVCWFAEMCLLEVFKSSLNTSFHPHPFSLFLGALKCFERHGKKENETCTALLLEEDLPLTHRPWLQLFLALAKLGFKKKGEYPNPTKKKKKKSLNISKQNIPKWLPETQLSCWTLRVTAQERSWQVLISSKSMKKNQMKMLR